MAALRECVRGDAVCKENLRPGKQVVVGVGSLDAKIMFVGEAPGGEEEEIGEPFVGPAGQLLTKMILAMGLSRSDVYIGNIMNWRPQMQLNESGVQYGNRPPNPSEMRYCLPYLRAQIEVVNPDLLVALGTTAAQGLLGPGSFKALGDIRGQWKEFDGRAADGDVSPELHSAESIEPLETHDLGRPAQSDGARGAPYFRKTTRLLPRQMKSYLRFLALGTVWWLAVAPLSAAEAAFGFDSVREPRQCTCWKTLRSTCHEGPGVAPAVDLR